MAKRLTDKEKEQIIKFFMLGKTLNELSQEFNYTKLTISRNIKKNLGEKKYKELTNRVKSSEKNSTKINKNNPFDKKDKPGLKFSNKNSDNEFLPLTNFVEIAPLNVQIDNSYQKDLASIPISEFEFPKIVYMIVDKKVELEIKYLKDYPKWNFLSEDDLKRKTIEIFLELKTAKSFCDKEQKVIKVPNTNVFKLASSFLNSRGITRIVSSDTLIAL